MRCGLQALHFAFANVIMGFGVGMIDSACDQGVRGCQRLCEVLKVVLGFTELIMNHGDGRQSLSMQRFEMMTREPLTLIRETLCV